jgi:chromosome segregation ATPase
MNLLQNNKNDTDQKVLNMKNQTDKQIKDLMQQVKNLNSLKFQLDNENKEKEEKIIDLERKNKEISINYQKKLNEIGNNYSSEKNNVLLSHNEQLKAKEEEIVKLNIKINSLEENIQSLNEIIEANQRDNKNNNNNGITENMTKLLEQISEKDKKIFNLQKQVNELNNKIDNDLDNKDTQSMLNSITEKELKNNINELQNLINEKDNELNELRNKYDTLKYESNKFHSKVDYNGAEDEFDNGNNEMFINQLKEIQKTYKEREEKLISEKNEEIRKLKMRNKDLVRESVLESNNNIDINKYINEINRLKNLNSTLEEDLGYYKELNSRFVDNEKKSTVYESENVRLKNLLDEKKNEIDNMQKKQKELIEQNDSLEKQLVVSKGKLGEVLNELAEAESKCVSLQEQQKK